MNVSVGASCGVAIGGRSFAIILESRGFNGCVESSCHFASCQSFSLLLEDVYCFLFYFYCLYDEI